MGRLLYLCVVNAFLVYPSFSLTHVTSSLDARVHPQGYITAESSGRTHQTAIPKITNGLGLEMDTVSLQLLNLPTTATIRLYVDFADM